MLFLLIVAASCSSPSGNLENVGVLMEDSMGDTAWERKAYQGLLEISDTYDVDVFYKENVKNEYEAEEAVEEFVRQGVNLIFGHSELYGKYFADIAEMYPDVHFVYFNGSSVADNLTSIHIDAYAMAFFAGMLAGGMTETGHVGILAEYEWQPEIEGFYSGVSYMDKTAQVHINYINNLSGSRKVKEMYGQMRENNVDIFYPAGDSFSRDIIQRAGADHFYVIGYLSDQFELDPTVVLTSTVEHIDEIYRTTAEQFNDNKLAGGEIHVDFQDKMISLGEFNPAVPKQLQQSIRQAIETYRETDRLPGQ